MLRNVDPFWFSPPTEKSRKGEKRYGEDHSLVFTSFPSNVLFAGGADQKGIKCWNSTNKNLTQYNRQKKTRKIEGLCGSESSGTAGKWVS